MFGRLFHSLTRLAETVQDPVDHPTTSRLSRRTFARLLALLAFGGTAAPLAARVLPSSVCNCNGEGQCVDPCRPHTTPCAGSSIMFPGGAANCWCEPKNGRQVYVRVCDCVCDGSRYCTCSTLYSPKCPRGGGGGDPGDLFDLGEEVLGKIEVEPKSMLSGR